MVVLSGHLFGKDRIQFDFDVGMVQDVLYERRIALFGHSLVGMGKIVVVVVKAKGKPGEDGGGQFLGITSPLLESVAGEEGMVKLFTHQAKPLFLKIFRICNRLVRLRLNKVVGFPRGELPAEALAKGEEVDGETEGAEFGMGLNAVCIGHELGVLIHIVPDFFDIGMENVRAVLVDHDVCFFVPVGTAVTGGVVLFVNDGEVVVFFRQVAGDYGAG